MKSIKRILALSLAVLLMMSINGLEAKAADKENTEQDEYIEISIEEAAIASTGNYSKGLVMLNIATTGVSNTCTITSGSVPDGATITKVELTGTKSTGSGTVNWYVTHNDSGLTAHKLFASPATFYNFNGLTADTSWTVWIEGSPWSTVRNGKIKVYYTY